MEQNKIKEIPYGVSDFYIVRRDNLYYVDKTMYLPKLEAQARNCFSFALAASVRACSSVCSMPTMTFSTRTSSKTCLATYG